MTNHVLWLMGFLFLWVTAGNATPETTFENYNFTTTTTRTIEFPIAEAETSDTLYLLPIGMGCAIPAGDFFMAECLTEESPLTMIESFSVPFLGVMTHDTCITYLFDNPYHTEVAFSRDTRGLLRLTIQHEFTTAGMTHPFKVTVCKTTGDAAHDMLTPAKVYRERYKDSLVTLTDKAKKTPEVAKLFGAAHVYLWGVTEPLTAAGVKDWKGLAADVRTALSSTTSTLGIQFDKALTAEEVKELKTTLGEQWLHNYAKTVLLEDCNKVASAMAENTTSTVQEQLAAWFPQRLKPINEWGGVLSENGIDKIRNAGIDRLWIGLDSWRAGLAHSQGVKAATNAGFLVAPYDSYHSMHLPDQPDSWETAQFGSDVYQQLAVVKEDGTTRTGFKKRGRLLNPVEAMPVVRKRIDNLMQQQPGFNSWFFDCDAFGEVFDNYGVTPPTAQQDDAVARVARMQWAADKYGFAVGSEGGNAYALPAIAFAHGIMSPVIAWGDHEMYDKASTSTYALGKYFPMDAPEFFFKQVPLKDKYFKRYFDPQYRAPLYRAAIGDCVIATHHWHNASRKFANAWQTIRLTELLYAVPPMEHINNKTIDKWLKDFAPYYAVSSPLLRHTATLPMTQWHTLTKDHMVQETVFGKDDEVVRVRVNFGTMPQEEMPPCTARIVYPDGKTVDYTTPKEKRESSKPLPEK